MTDPHALAKHADAAFFEDWSAGDDEHGCWIVANPLWRVIVVRPITSAMISMVERIGGKRIAHHRYDQSSGARDWHVPAAHWHKLKAIVPQLAALRAAWIAQYPDRHFGHRRR